MRISTLVMQNAHFGGMCTFRSESMHISGGLMLESAHFGVKARWKPTVRDFLPIFLRTSTRSVATCMPIEWRRIFSLPWWYFQSNWDEFQYVIFDTILEQRFKNCYSGKLTQNTQWFDQIPQLWCYVLGVSTFVNMPTNFHVNYRWYNRNMAR